VKDSHLQSLWFSNPAQYWQEIKKLTPKGERRMNHTWTGVVSAAVWDRTELLRDEEMDVFRNVRKQLGTD
jgi:hypothetical protein